MAEQAREGEGAGALVRVRAGEGELAGHECIAELIGAGLIERVLESHPAIDQAVVVGYPDDRLGQRVAACVIANAPFDLEECRAWFTARGIARFKTPERVVTVDRFPLLGLGKPDRLAVEALISRGS